MVCSRNSNENNQSSVMFQTKYCCDQYRWVGAATDHTAPL